jgi:hypothetical protein
MRGPAPTPAAGAPARPAFPRTEMVPTDPNAPPVVAGATPTEPAEVPFVAASGGGGGFGGGTPQGPLLQPGTYTVRLTAGGKTVTTSVDVLEDTWLAGKYSY